jgi:hypothetical protein
VYQVEELEDVIKNTKEQKKRKKEETIDLQNGRRR